MATTRERILAAAVVCFGRDGFDVGLREIGAEAGFSAALVVRQFGSKEGLRRACDEHIRAEIVRVKEEHIVEQDGRSVLAHLAHLDEYTHITAYVVQSLLDGGALARSLIEHMVTDASNYMAHGERAGLIRLSRDPQARARYLTYAGLGAMLMQLKFAEGESVDAVGVLRAVMDQQMLPMLEVYSEGLFTDGRYLDALLEVSDADHVPPTRHEPTTVPHDVATDPPG
ncbi:TetR/AcrR family transcriptional regulator [Ruania zhangjianzhongii]|uniref:TetR/AcrR family transcriptional regulator n=1 Tax=Ruania zhangjianzhongii TaxID=2603206 RepID=UPI0011C83759|nr:TetR family transcriptional regulator [Ruania zhangjianzhongii]